MKLPELRPRVPFAGVALAAVIGICLAHWCETSPIWDLAFLALLAAWVVRHPRTRWCLLFIIAAFFTLHTAQYFGSEARELSTQFAAGPRAMRATGIVWNEPQLPQKWSPFVTCRFLLKLESVEISGVHSPASALIHVRWCGEVPVYGDRVTILGTAENLEPARNPGQFDYAAFEQHEGVYSQISARYKTDCRITGHDAGQPGQRLALAAQRWIRARLAAGLEDSAESAALIQSMVLGVQSDTPEDLRDLFQHTGTEHLFAVSGVTVGMVAGILWFFLRMIQIERRWAAAGLIVLLVAYAAVTGFRTSCVRATIMASIFFGGYLFDRQPSPLNSLAAAAVFVLAGNTSQLFTPGFKLTFGVVLFVILVTERLHEWFLPFGLPDAFLPRQLWRWPQKARAFVWRWFSGDLSVSLTSFAGSLLFTAYYFHFFSLTSTLANLAAVPLTFVMLALSFASLAASAVWPLLGVVFNNANWCLANLMFGILHLSLNLPGGLVFVGTPHLLPPACELTVFDLGNGGATHVRADGADWLLDCGQGYDYRNVVLPYLRSRGLNGLAGLVLTHGSAPHIGAAPSVLEDLHPPIVVDSALKDRSRLHREFQATLEKKESGRRIVTRGDLIEISPHARFRVLFPPAGWEKSTADDKTLVLLLEAGGARVLFTFDSGFSTEEWLLQNEPDLHADLLVKGQHSKDLSGTPDFLSRVHPQVIVCAPPRLGASTNLDEWAEDVRQRRIALFRQDQSGAVQATIRNGELRAAGFVNGQTFRSRAR